MLGTKEPQAPRENFGGILAEEMGLGKTLSMLSSLIVSSEDANNFADKWAMEPRQGSQKVATRATLVVVPYERESTQHFYRHKRHANSVFSWPL